MTKEHLGESRVSRASMPPMFDRLIDYVPYHAAHVPSRPALVSPTREVAWGELPDAIDRLASALHAAGVGHGDRVAVWLPPTVDGILLFLACARLGALFVGVNPKYQLAEVEHLIADSSPTLLFAPHRTDERDYAAELRALAAQTNGPRVVEIELDGSGAGSLTEYARQAPLDTSRLDVLTERIQPSDPVALVYTSGSTGKPKGALLTQQGLAHNYWRAFQERHMEWLKTPAFFPINHLAGLGDIASLAVVAGGSQHFMQRFDPVALLELVERERLTYLPGLVTHFQLMFQRADVRRYDLSSVQYIWWGGALIPLELLSALEAICPRASTDFGQTETHGPLIYTPVDASPADKSLTIGRISDPSSVRIADENGAPVPIGQTGEIQARGSQTSPGYWRNPDASRRLYTRDGWLRTGDLAVQRNDGYVVMVGRISEMYKSGGYNVYPAEVEQAIGSHPAIDMGVVVSIPDPLYQEIGVAFVTLRRGHTASSEELSEHVRNRLANYKVPKRLYICRDLPRTIIGKIDKPRLRELASGKTHGLEEFLLRPHEDARSC